MQSNVKIVVISILLFLVIIGFVFFLDIAELQSIGSILFLFPAFPVLGLILAIAGRKIKTNRFKKLFFIGLLLIYITGLFLATFLILADDSGFANFSNFIYSVLLLGTTGFFIYGVLLLPFLIVGIYFIEYWTRPKKPF